MALPQGMAVGNFRTSRAFSSRRLQGRTSACEQLLEAKEAEIVRLRSELESWLNQAQHGAVEAAPSRRSRVGLSAKQRQQQDTAKAAARTSRARSRQAAENLEQARERLHSATQSLEGMEAYRSELTEALHREGSCEVAALAAWTLAEEQGDEEQQEIMSQQRLVQEANEELIQLQRLNHEEERELAHTQSQLNETILKQKACRAVLRQQRWTCQQLIHEKEILEDEVTASRPTLREEQAEQAAAFQELEEEVQTLESLGRNLPFETREVLDARRQEHESWKAELGHTEQELWLAQRQFREQQKKHTGTLASCRRQAHTREARAKAEAAQSFAARKKALQEAQQRFNKMHEKIRHQATRRKVNDAFKEPIFQQRKQNVDKNHSETIAKQQTFAVAERYASSEKHLEQGLELKELAYFEDRIHRLCREDQWLMAECCSVEEELEALRLFGTSPASPATAAKRAA